MADRTGWAEIKDRRMAEGAHRRPTGLRGWPTSWAAPSAGCGSSGTGAKPHSPTAPA